MMKRKLLIIAMLTFILPCFLGAQDYQANAKLDSTNILIGDQIRVSLSVSTPKGKPVIIPQFSQELLGPIDYIGSSEIDTIVSEQQTVFNQTIVITAFDSGSYLFPAIPILGLDSSVLAITQPLAFEVTTLQVDTTAAIRDIKPIKKVPLTFKELLPYILISLAATAIMTLMIWLIVKYKKKKKSQKNQLKAKPKVKPHITALRELEKLRQRKLWQDGKIKLYYSELTDIIRVYIERRYDISAMEMVSSDILDELDNKALSQELHRELYQILSTADLVKFAKWEPLPHDHDLCLKNAFDFVNQTAELSDNQTNKEELKR